MSDGDRSVGRSGRGRPHASSPLPPRPRHQARRERENPVRTSGSRVHPPRSIGGGSSPAGTEPNRPWVSDVVPRSRSIHSAGCARKSLSGGQQPTTPPGRATLARRPSPPESVWIRGFAPIESGTPVAPGGKGRHQPMDDPDSAAQTGSHRSSDHAKFPVGRKRSDRLTTGRTRRHPFADIRVVTPRTLVEVDGDTTIGGMTSRRRPRTNTSREPLQDAPDHALPNRAESS